MNGRSLQPDANGRFAAREKPRRESDGAGDGFQVLGCRFELLRQTEWLALDGLQLRRLRERACGRISVAGEIHVILASEPAATVHLSLVQLLSQRELQIAVEIARGAANKDIARLLGISHLTVAEYVRRILHKLGLHSRAAVAASIGSSL